jgi:hypothetical protein
MQNENGTYNPDMSSDFDLEQEFKAAPLIPSGTYHANVTKTWLDTEQNTLNFNFCLVDNGGLMSDGETAVDGTVQVLRNWLPKPGDDKEMTKDGKMTKRQSKINQLGKFADFMGIPRDQFKNLTVIKEHCDNATWVGLRASVTIGSREYEGKIYNEISKVRITPA